ncbi:hypothetical protein DL89DRAFT_254517 [Linderina pennispora]|uniref:Uncharacterized protein n=1 Tax=Linderina pennispora TaxID=61395 RepID=A0A1Y1WN46_9FUNG|nr:uncharacterized protein DL89DRAFT_254517 [Linderina pennispora]ORX74728.1 hypothetical protein DL89DRAFT_254517 [Linderina pennispora]
MGFPAALVSRLLSRCDSALQLSARHTSAPVHRTGGGGGAIFRGEEGRAHACAIPRPAVCTGRALFKGDQDLQQALHTRRAERPTGLALTSAGPRTRSICVRVHQGMCRRTPAAHTATVWAEDSFSKVCGRFAAGQQRSRESGTALQPLRLHPATSGRPGVHVQCVAKWHVI